MIAQRFRGSVRSETLWQSPSLSFIVAKTAIVVFRAMDNNGWRRLDGRDAGDLRMG
jgi:hypothetical protein